MPTIETQQGFDSPEDAFEDAIKNANMAWERKDFFSVRLTLDLRGYKKSQLFKANPFPISGLPVYIVSGVFTTDKIRLPMGKIASPNSPMQGETVFITPVSGDKLYIFMGAIDARENDNDCECMVYGGADGIHLESVVPSELYDDQEKRLSENRPLISAKDLFDMPDDVQAFLNRGYSHKAAYLMSGLNAAGEKAVKSVLLKDPVKRKDAIKKACTLGDSPEDLILIDELSAYIDAQLRSNKSGPGKGSLDELLENN